MSLDRDYELIPVEQADEDLEELREEAEWLLDEARWWAQRYRHDAEFATDFPWETT